VVAGTAEAEALKTRDGANLDAGMNEITIVITSNDEMTARGTDSPETVPGVRDGTGPEAEALEEAGPEARDGVGRKVQEIGVVGEVQNGKTMSAALEVPQPGIVIAVLGMETSGDAEVEIQGRDVPLPREQYTKYLGGRNVAILVLIDAGKNEAGCLRNLRGMIMKKKALWRRVEWRGKWEHQRRTY